MRDCAGPQVSVHSAGSGDRADVDPVVSRALGEVGIDLDDAYSKPLTDEVLRAADVVVNGPQRAR